MERSGIIRWLELLNVINKRDIKMLEEILNQIPNQPQRQDSMLEQLNDLHRLAITLGMYDAADGLRACWNLDKPELS